MDSPSTLPATSTRTSHSTAGEVGGTRTSGEKRPLGVRLQFEDSPLTSEVVLAAIGTELGVLVGESESGPLEVAISADRLTMSYSEEGKPPVSRQMSLPARKEEQLEVIALLSHNLLRDEAAELLALLAPTPTEEGVSPEAPEDRPAPGPEEEEQQRDGLPSDSEGEAGEGVSPGEESPGLQRSDLAFMVTPKVSFPSDPELSEARFLLALLTARIGRLRGFGASLLTLRSDHGFRGFAASTLFLRSKGESEGVGAALLGSNLGGEGDEHRGLQVALGYAGAGSLKGVQAAFVSQTSAELSGAQFGLVSLSGSVRGVQAGLYSQTNGPLKGLQLGLVSIARGPVHGLQLGLVNVAGEGKTQIGLVNVAHAGKGSRWGLVSVGPGVRPQLLVWGSHSGLGVDSEGVGGFLGHLGVRTLAGGLLSMVSVGLGRGDCLPADVGCVGRALQVAPGVTLGGRFDLNRLWKLELDAQYRYAFLAEHFATGAHSLGPRLSITLEPLQTFGVFVGAGAEASWTNEADSIWFMEHLFAGVSFF